MDVKISNAGRSNVDSVGGTINFQLKKSSEALPGYYQQGIIKLTPDGYTTNRYLHLIHHESTDGAKIGKFLCSVGGHDGFGENAPNVYSRYDWCHYRNWGTCSDTE